MTRRALYSACLAAAAGALCAGCGSSHHAAGASPGQTVPHGHRASVAEPAAARSGYLRAGPAIHLSVQGDRFEVALVGSRTVPGPAGKAAVPGREWLEADIQVKSLQTHGSSDIGWLDNALDVYATPHATGVSCAHRSVFAGLCELSAGDFVDAHDRPGETFLDASLPPGGSADVWVLATELKDGSAGRDMTLTLAPLIYGVQFSGRPLVTSNAPSGQVPLSAGGPRLVRQGG